MCDVIAIHWIDVMNHELAVDFIPFNTKITTVVTNDDVLANLFPLVGRVERLVDVSVKPKCSLTDRASEFQVIEAIFETVVTT